MQYLLSTVRLTQVWLCAFWWSPDRTCGANLFPIRSMRKLFRT